MSGARGPPPEAQQIDTGLRGVLQIDIPAGQPNTLFRGPNGIVATERGTGVELARTKLVAGGVGSVPATTQNDVTAGACVVATD